MGCVIYEMLTGTPAFAGENLSERSPPFFAASRTGRRSHAETPSRIRVLLRRCLQKDSRQRLHDVADVRIEIDDRDADATPAAASPRHTRDHRVAWVVPALVSGAALASLSWWVGTRPSRATPAPIHLSLTLANHTASFAI